MSDTLDFRDSQHQCKGCIAELEVADSLDLISCACTLDDHEFTEDPLAPASAV
jgi:hypothetical protein